MHILRTIAVLVALLATILASGAADAGNTVQFNTKAHPRALGVDVSFQVPASWKQSRTPNAVQTFTASDSGNIRCTLVVSVIAFDQPELKTAFEQRAALATLNQNKAYFEKDEDVELVSIAPLTLADHFPACNLFYRCEPPTVDTGVVTYARRLSFFVGDKVALMDFRTVGSIASVADWNQITAVHVRHVPDFDAIERSIKIHHAVPQTPPPAPAGSARPSPIDYFDGGSPLEFAFWVGLGGLVVLIGLLSGLVLLLFRLVPDRQRRAADAEPAAAPDRGGE